jgi:hypothetical protein
VSYVIVVVELAVLLVPAVSVNVPNATDTEPVPDCVLVVGVNTTVYELPEPAKDESVPPTTVMSPTANVVDDSDSVMVNVDV